MKIPIFNAIYFDDKKKKISSKEIDLKKLNNLNLTKPDINKFPALNILKLLPNKTSLFETILISTNDEIVNFFLNKKISFDRIVPTIIKIIKSKNFIKYKRIFPKNLNNITELNKIVRFKIKSMVYKI